MNPILEFTYTNWRVALEALVDLGEKFKAIKTLLVAAGVKVLE